MNRPNYLPKIGIQKLHLGVVTRDEAKTVDSPAVYEASAPQRIPYLVAIAFNADQNNEPFYADDEIAINQKGTPTYAPEVEIADMPPEDLVKFVGGVYKNAIYSPSGGTFPEIAMSYRMTKPNGAFRYVRFYKGNITMPLADGQTKADGLDYQTASFTYGAMQSQALGQPFSMLDDDDPRLVAAGITPEEVELYWFSDWTWEPNIPASASVSPTTLKEATANDGSLDPGILLVQLQDGEFIDPLPANAITIASLPADLTVGTITRATDTVARVQITGQATAHDAADSVTGLVAQIAKEAVTDANADIVADNTFDITFTD